MKSFGIALCVWIVWLFIVRTIMKPQQDYEDIGAFIVAVAATAISIYLFRHFASKN